MATPDVPEDRTVLLKKCSELKEALRFEKSRLADTHCKLKLVYTVSHS